jgi:hypothetical protein
VLEVALKMLERMLVKNTNMGKGCNCAQNFEEDNYYGGDELVKQLSLLTGRKIIANQDPTSDLVKDEFLGEPRTSVKWFEKGFTFGIRGLLERTGKNLKLNANGVPYEFVHTPPVKKE